MSCQYLNLQEPNECPYSDLVVVDDQFLFLSGLVSEDFETGELVPGDIATETRKPARLCFGGADLAEGCKIEIMATAVKK